MMGVGNNMIHDISITEEALGEIAKDLRCTLSNLKRLLGIKERTFKPFDQILVKDTTDSPWKPNIFSWYDKQETDYPYVTISGSRWRYCIPYEGNEDKVNKV